MGQITGQSGQSLASQRPRGRPAPDFSWGDGFRDALLLLLGVLDLRGEGRGVVYVGGVVDKIDEFLAWLLFHVPVGLGLLTLCYA